MRRRTVEAKVSGDVPGWLRAGYGTLWHELRDGTGPVLDALSAMPGCPSGRTLSIPDIIALRDFVNSEGLRWCEERGVVLCAARVGLLVAGPADAYWGAHVGVVPKGNG